MVPCEKCGKPSGVSVATLQANGATVAICSACSQKLGPKDPGL